tara:strand:+ start:1767 stop:2162 length:396 start_codon:yes stop_codon:yes gene_type:complete
MFSKSFLILALPTTIKSNTLTTKQNRDNLRGNTRQLEATIAPTINLEPTSDPTLLFKNLNYTADRSNQTTNNSNKINPKQNLKETKETEPKTAGKPKKTPLTLLLIVCIVGITYNCFFRLWRDALVRNELE